MKYCLVTAFVQVQILTIVFYADDGAPHHSGNHICSFICQSTKSLIITKGTLTYSQTRFVCNISQSYLPTVLNIFGSGFCRCGFYGILLYHKLSYIGMLMFFLRRKPMTSYMLYLVILFYMLLFIVAHESLETSKMNVKEDFCVASD